MKEIGNTAIAEKLAQALDEKFKNPEEEARKKEHVFIDTFPNLEKLMEVFTAREVSDAIGIGYSSVHTMMRERRVRPAYELAAAHLLVQLGEKVAGKEPEIVIVARVKTDDMPFVARMLKTLGITPKVI